MLQIRSLIIIYLGFLASLTTVPATSLTHLTSLLPTAKNFGNLLTYQTPSFDQTIDKERCQSDSIQGLQQRFSNFDLTHQMYIS